ncbi:MAG: serpin family protein, partial [FCB group bacterium]|nr:serpin family protein [FCB group bacterium]
MMKNSVLDTNYLSENDFQAVRLPSGREVMWMYIFMPGYGDELDDFIAGITPPQWNDWIASFQSPYDIYGVPEFEGGNFRMPKFKASYQKELEDVLTSLGMGLAFTGGADFSGICSELPLFISFVRQKAVIEVNEEGSEAAAATVVGMEQGVSPPVFSFSVNRPFFFVIRDDRTETILFMGKIVDPKYD